MKKYARDVARSLVRLVGLTALPWMLGSCVTAQEEFDFTPPTSETLASDTRYLAELVEARMPENGYPYVELDLTDDRHYQLVIRRLVASGHTLEGSPKLFEQLRQTRLQAIAEKETAGTSSEGVGTAQQALEAAPCTHFIHLEEEATLNGNKFKPKAIMSCYPGIQYASIDVSLYETNLDESIPYQYWGSGSNDFPQAQAYNMTATLTTANAVNKLFAPTDQNIVVLDSVAMVVNSQGNVKVTTVVIKTVAANTGVKMTLVDGLKPTHPQNRKSAVPDVNNPLYDGDGRIRQCLDRGWGNNSDCDYFSVRDNNNGTFSNFTSPRTGVAAADLNSSVLKADPNAYWPASPYTTSRTYMPVRGNYKLYHPDNNCYLDTWEAASTQAYLVADQAGAFCPGNVAGDIRQSTFAAAFATPAGNATTTTFSALPDFGPCGGITSGRTSALYLTSYAKPKHTGAGQKCGYRYASAVVRPIDLKQSCFAEGTEIRRADGVLVPVEKLRTGEQVISNASGTPLTIMSVAYGIEQEPIVNLMDDEGHDLFVTAKHPIVTPTGIIAAEKLTEGDHVLTDRGVTTLVSVTRLSYSGQVYNFLLGTDDEAAKVGQDHRTMFAEGYLVGDDSMQFALEHADKPQATGVPAGWEVDYRTAERLNASRKAK